jgi:DNA-binding transcriptional LysR family regulator
LEIRNLNTFLQVAALQNFTQASRELGYSQSNVSAQIKQLEQEIGAPLFNRIGRNITLTPYGKGLLPYARQIVSTSLQIKNYLKSEEAMGGTIRVGMVESVFELLGENVFLQYHHRFPKVYLELVVDATSSLKDRLQHGLLDAACLIDDPLLPTQWIVWDAIAVPVVVIANPAHPLSHQKVVRLDDLVGQDIILMEDSAPYSIHFHNTLANQKIELTPFLKLQSANIACRLVERGLFLSVLPLYTVHSSAQAGRISILNVLDWKQTQLVQLIVYRSKVITPQIQGFLEELRNVLSKKLPGEDDGHP